MSNSAAKKNGKRKKSGRKMLVTSTELMMIQFLVPHVKYLTEKGWNIEVACSNVGGRIDEVKEALKGVAKVHVVELYRNPARPQNLKGLLQMKKLIDSRNWDIIWTNEPVMGVMTRLAAQKARRRGTKVVYIAHGFHFYKGAPLQNWVFAPIEIGMSLFNDVIVTINWEDFNWAEKHLFTKDVRHIDGIGVDFSTRQIVKSREEKRLELGVKEDEILVLSVGELKTRKNHEPVLRALAKLDYPNVKYYICGIGELHDYLQNLADELGMADRFQLLGYRKDIPEIMNAADIYAHPSLREGLGLASLEAMAAGLPLVTSNVQGIPDYVENGVTGYMCSPHDLAGFRRNLNHLIKRKGLRNKIGKTNQERVKKYAVENIELELQNIFESLV